MATKAAASKVNIVVPPIDMETVQIPIRGIKPLVTHNWSAKAIRDMLRKQMGHADVPQEPKDPEQCFKEAQYVATDGSYGMPCTAFKSAMVRAGYEVGIDMTKTRGRIFVEADCQEDRRFTAPLAAKKGQPAREFTQRIKTDLVRILGEPEMDMKMVRLGGKKADVRFRPIFHEWEAILTIRYQGMTAEAVANLVNRAGATVGVGEGRPEQKTDMSWGLFTVDLGGKGKRPAKKRTAKKGR